MSQQQSKIINFLKNLSISIARWFDSSIGMQEVQNQIEERQQFDSNHLKVDWIRCIPFLLLHLVCFSVIWVSWSWAALGVCFALYIIRMFAITGFYHRYFSHRTFETSRFWQFIFAFVGNSAAQRGPLWWAAHHRHHHRHSDDPKDHHSPHQHGFLWSHMLWFTAIENFPTNLKEVKDLAKFPELRFLDRFASLAPLLLAISMYSLGQFLNIHFPHLGTNGWQMLVWGFFISTILVFHGTCTINSLSHQIGTRRFKTSDESKNNLFLAFVTLGEGWHNNHHYYPGSVRQGFYWWEIDITYYLLKLLSQFGIIWNLRPVPEKVYLAAKNQKES